MTVRHIIQLLPAQPGSTLDLDRDELVQFLSDFEINYDWSDSMSGDGPALFVEPGQILARFHSNDRRHIWDDLYGAAATISFEHPGVPVTVMSTDLEYESGSETRVYVDGAMVVEKTAVVRRVPQNIDTLLAQLRATLESGADTGDSARALLTAFDSVS